MQKWQSWFTARWHNVVTLAMKGCICHFVKWQIHPFISKVFTLGYGNPWSWIMYKVPRLTGAPGITQVTTSQCWFSHAISQKPECMPNKVYLEPKGAKCHIINYTVMVSHYVFIYKHIASLGLKGCTCHFVSFYHREKMYQIYFFYNMYKVNIKTHQLGLSAPCVHIALFCAFNP